MRVLISRETQQFAIIAIWRLWPNAESECSLKLIASAQRDLQIHVLGQVPPGFELGLAESDPTVITTYTMGPMWEQN